MYVFELYWLHNCIARAVKVARRGRSRTIIHFKNWLSAVKALIKAYRNFRRNVPLSTLRNLIIKNHVPKSNVLSRRSTPLYLKFNSIPKKTLLFYFRNKLFLIIVPSIRGGSIFAFYTQNFPAEWYMYTKCVCGGGISRLNIGLAKNFARKAVIIIIVSFIQFWDCGENVLVMNLCIHTYII